MRPIQTANSEIYVHLALVNVVLTLALSLRYWDIPPQGFEHLTPGQYKAMQAAGQLPTRVLGLTPTANIAAQYPMAGGYFTRQGIFDRIIASHSNAPSLRPFIF